LSILIPVEHGIDRYLVLYYSVTSAIGAFASYDLR